MDHQVRSAVTSALKRRDVDVVTAENDGSDRLPDADLLTRATKLGRVLFTQDADLLAEGARRLRAGETFAGVIYVKQRRLTDRQIIEDLALIAGASDAAEWLNRVEYLPLK